ncbi:MAG: DNA-directed RNA polymerase subunit L [Candidatus Heimdallarchaeota archaeon]|nr:DNA-directed RNA polymerase subunit L [Candidatus Heimdallarchaeota archaeon]MDH5644846.1 DNA-directed RNA polymerase subunit L [Candidatus Heimdallarchaeota archaeon]
MKPMNVKIQILEPDYLRMQIKEDPHTIFNLLRVLALEEEGVKLAGYARDRTFEDSVMFQIRTDGSVDPRDAIVNAARKAIELTEQFKEAFEDTYL